MANNKVMGYLPNDQPPLGQMILLGFQHILTMFPATVFVALLTGFHVGTVLLGSGISTIVALLLSKRGFGLAFAALGNLASANFTVALITLLVTVLFSVYLQTRGFIGMLPILLGGIVGYIISGVFDAGSVNLAAVG